VGGLHAGADEGGGHVQTGLPRHGHIGGVMGVHVQHGGDVILPGQVGKTGHHVVIIGAGGVGGADGDGVLVTGQVQTHTAHIHRQQLGEGGGEGGAAVTHFLIDGEGDLHVAAGG